jgi:hypothetical protein
LLKCYKPGEKWIDGRIIYAESWTPGVSVPA